MKKVLGLLIAVILIIGISSCKKTNSGINTSQWNFNGKTYNGTSTIFITSGSISAIEATDVISDSITNYILVEFGSKPVNNEKFTVISGTGTADSTQCAVGVGSVDSTHVPILIAESVGSIADTVTVTIVDGKYHVSFSNLAVQEYSSTLFTGVSGTLIQQ